MSITLNFSQRMARQLFKDVHIDDLPGDTFRELYEWAAGAPLKKYDVYRAITLADGYEAERVVNGLRLFHSRAGGGPARSAARLIHILQIEYLIP